MSNDGEHNSFLNLRQLFESQPDVVAILTDQQLTKLFSIPVQDQTKAARLYAELWTRSWLYENRCPSDLISCLGQRSWSPTFRGAFDTSAMSLRRPAVDSGSHNAELLQTPAGLNENEQWVWDCMRRRLHDFLNCDGLLALVPPGSTDNDAGVAVPFRLEPGTGIVNANHVPISPWEKEIESFSQCYHLGMKVRVLTLFPRDRQPNGASLELPLAIARERLAGRLPWYSPLDVMASGTVADSVIGFVDGVPAKQTLAAKIGAYFFAPSAQQEGRSVHIPDRTPLQAAFSTIQNTVQSSLRTPARSAEIVARCRQELQLWKAITPRTPIGRLQEMERLLINAGIGITAGSSSSTEHTDACNLRVNLSASVNGSESLSVLIAQETYVLKPYRERAIYGRDLFVGDLNRFIQESGGLLPVTGISGYGKTALLVHWLASSPSSAACFTHFFRADRESLRDISRFFQRLAQFLTKLIPESYQEGAPQGELGRGDVERLLWIYSTIRSHERPKLLIVLDGIDEASTPYFPCFFPFLRDSWPEGLHVVVSARTDGTPEFSEIQTWLEASTKPPLNLTSIDKTALQDWLRASSHPLPMLAKEPEFVETLLARSKGEGSALYLQHQIERLEKVADLEVNWRRELHDMPEGYAKLIGQQFDHVFKQSSGKSHEDLALFKDLLELLTSARGPLDEMDLRALLNTNQIPNFGELHRWVTVSAGTSGRGHEFRFNYQLIREALEKHGLPLQAARTKLLKYCLEWQTQEHPSPYVLRHLVGHLKEALPSLVVSDPPGTLFDLAANPRFLKAQSDAFPDDLHASLRTLQSALALASDQNNVFQMARLGLAHAHRVSEISRESPLAAVRAGHYDRASALIAIYERREDRMLWHLLLAVEFLLRSDSARSTFTLQEVLPAEASGARFLPEHSGAALAMAFLILSKLDLASHDGLINMFHADDQLTLCRILSESGAIKQALSVWRAIQPQIQADQAGRCYLRCLAEAGQPEAAFLLLDQIKAPYTRDFARSDIAKSYAKADDISGARRVLLSMAPRHALQRVEALCAIAESPVSVTPTSVINEAWAIVDSLKTGPSDQALRATATTRIAITELLIGLPDHSAKNVNDAIKIATTLPSEPQKVACLSDLAQVFLDLPARPDPAAKALNAIFQALQRTLKQFEGSRHSPYAAKLSDELLLRMAQQHSSAGHSDAAHEIARSIHLHKNKRHQAFASILANSYRQRQTISLPLTKHFRVSKSDLLHIHSQALLERAVAGHLGGLLDEVAGHLIRFAPDRGVAHWGAARVLGAIGMAASSRGEHALAQAAFEKAHAELIKFDHDGTHWHYAWALKNLAEDQAKANYHDNACDTFGTALSAARKERRAKQKARLLSEIAGSKALAFGGDAAQPTFQESLDVVCGGRWKFATDQIEALGQIIEDQCKSGLNQAANDTLDIAEAIIRGMDSTSDGVWLAQAQLALSLAKSTRFVPEYKYKARRHADDALVSFRGHDRSKWEGAGKAPHPPQGLANRVYAILAASDASVEDAMNYLLRIQDVGTRSKGARDLAIAFLEAKKFNGFDAALSHVTNGRSELLPDIAQELLVAKNKDGIKQFFRESVFFLDCTHRMLALLIKLKRPDGGTLRQIMSLVTPVDPQQNNNPPAAANMGRETAKSYQHIKIQTQITNE